MVVAHQSVDEPGNCFAVPPITVTVVCVAKVVLKWQWLPCHTHHDACDEPPIPTTHTSMCAQMVDMELVVVLVMAMECDGAFMVTITTLVLPLTHNLTVKREMERGTVVDSHHLTTPSSGGWLEWLVCKQSG